MGKALLRASVSSSVTWGDNRSHLTGLLADLLSINERCGVYGGKTQSKGWSLGKSKYSLFWGEIAHSLLREPGSSLVPSKPTLLGHQLGTKAPAPLLPATGGRCGAPTRHKAGRTRALSHTDHQRWPQAPDPKTKKQANPKSPAGVTA